MLEPLRNPREGKHSLPWTFPASQGKHVSVLLVLFLSGGMVQYRSPFHPPRNRNLRILPTYFFCHSTKWQLAFIGKPSPTGFKLWLYDAALCK